MKFRSSWLVVLATIADIVQASSGSQTDLVPLEPRDDSSQQEVSDEGNEPSKGVLGIPSIVTAGEQTIWHLDMSKSTLASQNHTRMQIYLRTWPQDPTRTNLPYYFSNLYCHIVDCVRTNVTSFAVTIPKDAFPDNIRMRTSFDLAASPDVGWSHWGDDYTEFILEGGTGKWSDYELTEGWTPVNHWSTALDCVKVTCARSCIQQHLDASKKWYYAQDGEAKAAFRDCIEACGPQPQRYQPSQCISSDVTMISPTTSTAAAEPTGTSGSISAAQTTTATNDASLLSNFIYVTLFFGGIYSLMIHAR